MVRFWRCRSCVPNRRCERRLFADSDFLRSFRSAQCALRPWCSVERHVHGLRFEAGALERNAPAKIGNPADRFEKSEIGRWRFRLMLAIEISHRRIFIGAKIACHDRSVGILVWHDWPVGILIWIVFVATHHVGSRGTATNQEGGQRKSDDPRLTAHVFPPLLPRKGKGRIRWGGGGAGSGLPAYGFSPRAGYSRNAPDSYRAARQRTREQARSSK
jgi:hypothetical protein